MQRKVSRRASGGQGRPRADPPTGPTTVRVARGSPGSHHGPFGRKDVDLPPHPGVSPSSTAPMPSAQRRSTDAFEVPSHPAVSWAASPCAAASRMWAMSTPALASSGPGWKSATGRENMTSASSGLARTNVSGGRPSGGDAEVLVELVGLDRVAAQERVPLALGQPGRVAEFLGYLPRVGPGRIGVRVVGLEQQLLEADLVAILQP